MASTSIPLSKEDRKKAAVIEKQVRNSNRFYAAAFVYDETGRVQRVAAQRRTALQTILNIERELERRMRQRKKKKSTDEE